MQSRVMELAYMGSECDRKYFCKVLLNPFYSVSCRAHCYGTDMAVWLMRGATSLYPAARVGLECCVDDPTMVTRGTRTARHSQAMVTYLFWSVPSLKLVWADASK